MKTLNLLEQKVSVLGSYRRETKEEDGNQGTTDGQSFHSEI